MSSPAPAHWRNGLLTSITLAGFTPLVTTAAQTAPPPISTLRKTTVTATLPETVAEGTGSYIRGALTVGSKQPRSIRHTPQSVSVATEQRIRDQRLNTLDNVLMQTPGISVQNEYITGSGFFARGFLVQTGQPDRVPMTLGANNHGYSSPDIAIYDHVEMLRGSRRPAQWRRQSWRNDQPGAQATHRHTADPGHAWSGPLAAQAATPSMHPAC